MLFQRSFVPSYEGMSSNDHLRLASTFHGLHAFSCTLSPVVASSGIQELECDTFRLRSYQTPTGLKFYVVAHPDTSNLAGLLQDVYQLFCDYVLKNPFYEPDQPIKAAKFEVNLDKLIKAKK